MFIGKLSNRLMDVFVWSKGAHPRVDWARWRDRNSTLGILRWASPSSCVPWRQMLPHVQDGPSIVECHTEAPAVVPAYPVKVPVCVLAVPLLLLLPADLPGRTVEDGLGAWSPAPTWEIWRRIFSPVFWIRIAQLWPKQPCGKWTSKWNVSLSFSL